MTEEEVRYLPTLVAESLGNKETRQVDHNRYILLRLNRKVSGRNGREMRQIAGTIADPHLTTQAGDKTGPGAQDDVQEGELHGLSTR